MIVDNPNLTQRVLTFVRDSRVHDQVFYMGNQYRWTRKEYIVNTNCDCSDKRNYWKYYVNAYGDGCPLEGELEEYPILGEYDDGFTPIACEDEYYPQRKFRKTWEEEHRLIDMNTMVPQSEQEPDSLYFDDRLSRRLGV